MPELTGSQPEQSFARSFSKNRNIFAGLLFVSVALLLLLVLIPYGVDAPKKVKFVALHPAYYPKLVSYCLLLLGGLVLANGLKDRMMGDKRSASITAIQSDDADASAELADNPQDHPDGNYKKLLLLAVLLMAIFLGLPFFGFPLTACVALLLIMPLAGERRWWLVALVAVLLPMLLYLFFTKVANIPIPGGIADPWLLKL